MGGPSGRRDRKRPATGVDSRRVRVEPPPPRRRAHRPLSGSLARQNHGNADRRLVGDDGRARRRGQGQMDRRVELRRRTARALRDRSPRRLRAADAVDAGPWRPPDGAAVGVCARHRNPLLLAPRVGHPRRWNRHEAAAGARRRRLAPELTGVPGARRLSKPGVRGPLEDRRRRARCRATGARRRLGARAAGRHGRDRRCADDAARRRLGRSRRSSSSTNRHSARSTVRWSRPAPGRTNRPRRRHTSTR